MPKRQSILFVRPDYHCSFHYRDELRRLGWKADIYVNHAYPEKLLYSDHDILRAPRLPGDRRRFVRRLNHLLLLLWFLGHFWRYRYHVYYGRPPSFSFLEQRLGLTRLFGDDFLVELALLKAFGCKVVYLPPGCNDEETQAHFATLDGGNVCANCGAFDRCDDRANTLNFRRIRRYADLCAGFGMFDSSQFHATHFKYKVLDLQLWSPDLHVPEPFRLPPTGRIRILHSFFPGGRDWNGRNIKGSPYVLAAIERLRAEGHPVEYLFLNDKPSRQMRYYQVQADIVVEQLIYGMWGSTGVETMALGKPVVCYLRPAWKAFFLKTYPEYRELPIVEATTDTIYAVLKRLVTDPDYRRRKGEESRRFAEAHYDLARNTRALADLLERL